MVLVDKPYDHAVLKRTLDYYSRETPWPRQLWRLSSVLEISELLEAVRANRSSVLGETAVKYLGQSLAGRVKRDVGFGTEKQRGILIGYLSRPLSPGGHDAYALRTLAEQAEDRYLQCWADEVRRSKPSPEVVSRAVGSYLLDIGFSATALHKWWTYHGSHAPNTYGIADMIEEAISLSRRLPCRYNLLIPISSSPPLSAQDDAWLSPTATSEWLNLWFPEAPAVRQAGALQLAVDARDVYSAVEQAANEATRLTARFRVGARQRLTFGEYVYVVGLDGPTPYAQPPRRVEVHALQRTSIMFDLNLSHELNSVLELLDPLDSGTPAAAVAGSWAAMEALFVGPDDGKNRVIAATRMARIVACSYVRAELTALANSYMMETDDKFANELKAKPDNISRARAMEEQLRTNPALKYKRTRHALAHARMKALVDQPDVVLPKVIGQLEDAFRRLYRQRNLILHAGDLTSVALRGTLRTVAPLVGAGIDRIVHASATRGLSPLEVAAHVEINLARASDVDSRLVDLLG